MHCLSSSGRRDPRELTTAECKAVIDELERMQVFYVNIGGGEPTVRKDFWELVEYATAHHVGVKFSTNGSRIDAERAAWLRGERLRRRADLARRRDRRGQRRACAAPAPTTPRSRAMEHLPRGIRLQALASSSRARTRRSSTRSRRSPTRYGAQLRLTRLRPSGRGADVWDELHPTQAQQRVVYDWLLAHGEDVLTGDSFFHLAAYGQTLPGLNLCGAGRVVCLIDPVGDVYACPFAIHDTFLAGNVRDGGFARRVARVGAVPRAARAAGGGRVRRAAACTTPAAAAAWRRSSSPACRSTAPTRSACSATARRRWPRLAAPPKPSADHSRGAARSVPVTVVTRPATSRRSDALVRVASRRPAAGRRGPARVGLQGDPGRRRARADARGQRRRVRGARLRAARRGAARPSATLATTVMGVDVSLPVLLSPAGVQAVHPDGELGVARAAAARGTAMGLSGLASTGDRGGRRRQPEDVRAAVLGGLAGGDRGAGRAGARGGRGGADRHARLDVLATRATGAARSSRSSSTCKTMARLAPEVLRAAALGCTAGRRPGARRRSRSPTSRARPGSSPPTASGWGRRRRRWEDVALAARRCGTAPFMVKGVMRVDDARRAVEDVGATALSVSNHGGNNLDGTPATIRALAAVVEAVGDEPRCCSTAASGAAATSSRRWRSAPAR